MDMNIIETNRRAGLAFDTEPIDPIFAKIVSMGWCGDRPLTLHGPHRMRAADDTRHSLKGNP